MHSNGTYARDRLDVATDKGDRCMIEAKGGTSFVWGTPRSSSDDRCEPETAAMPSSVADAEATVITAAKQAHRDGRWDLVNRAVMALLHAEARVDAMMKGLGRTGDGMGAA